MMTTQTISFEEVEEERWVLYVAMTRAKDELIITRQNLNT
jgi:DNA helicase-2/ATP-dependent DNA helicase PcrA